jgi:subtilisin family serine protease
MKRFPKSLSTQRGSELVLDETRLVVAFKEDIELKAAAEFGQNFQIVLEQGPRSKSGKHWEQVNHSARRVWFTSQDGKPIDEKRYKAFENALGDRAEWIGPVYFMVGQQGLDSYLSPVPNALLVRKRGQENIGAIAKELGMHVNEARSKYLTAFYYLEIDGIKKSNAYELKSVLEKKVGEVLYESMPLMKPLAATIPNDTFWANQWNLTQINAPNGWDISTGNAGTVICVLDEGCDLTHPDLQFSEQGINLGTMMPTGAPTGNHGTACAGIAAATFNNNAGVAGVAGGCSIMPVAFAAWTDVEVANGINYATTNGAEVISMSFGWNPWNPAIIDPEILNAFNNNVVMCVATHNHNAAITYPATNPLVIAVGGSSTDDNRKVPASPDGECWGANFGDVLYNGVQTGVSVVAPCVQCPSTDRQGAVGYNNNGALTPNPWACVNYPAQPADGNYLMVFDGTSAATPHVAGLAGLIISQYPTLSGVQVRRIIETSAAKVGALAYAETAGFANGTRNQEMGYGRIDVFRALDMADIMIKDWAGDDGSEPSTAGNFWDFSDIVVRIFDDNVFNPSNPAQSKNVERGQENFIYVQVTNKGPRDARNVNVNIRITPYVGLQFVYPNDWTLVDGMHVNPTSLVNNFGSVPTGSTAMAKFSISAAQVELLYGWETANPWHPCLLAQVVADNDYAYTTADLSFGNIVTRKNNFAQRNLTVIDVLASPGGGAAIAFPFVIGSKFVKQNAIYLTVDRSQLPKGSLVLLDFGNQAHIFPGVDFTPGDKKDETCDSGFTFFERTRIKTRFGCCDAVLTVEKGSKITFCSCEGKHLKARGIKGGEYLVNADTPMIKVLSEKTSVEFESEDNTLYALQVRINFPADASKEALHTLKVYQTDAAGKILGGGTAIYKLA